MELRNLGTTGVKVSPLCLGAMMFGAWGERDHDMTIPANQRKLDAADELASVGEEAGISLIELAIAFVIGHPAVTTAIIGPRTREHLESQLTAVDVALSDEILDRIDEFVPPGTNVNPADAGWQNPDLRPEARRRPVV